MDKVAEGNSQDGAGSLHTEWSDGTVNGGEGYDQCQGTTHFPWSSRPLCSPLTIHQLDADVEMTGRLTCKQNVEKIKSTKKKTENYVREIQTGWQWCDDMRKWKWRPCSSSQIYEREQCRIELHSPNNAHYTTLHYIPTDWHGILYSSQKWTGECTNTKTVKINTVFHRNKDTVPSWEEDFMANHFRQNAAHRPYVH